MNTPDKTVPENAKQRIGILGGSFDPIHLGHLLPAKETIDWLQLDKLHLLPAHLSPHKSSTTASAKQREEMIRLACIGEAKFYLDSRELKRPPPSYTVDTIKEISSEMPSSQLFFIVGMDSLINFTTWHRWQEILNYCHLVVNQRPENPSSNLNEHLPPELMEYITDDLPQTLSTDSGKILLHQQTEYNISSTEIRKEIGENIYDESKLSSATIPYIKHQQLYRK